MTGAAGFLGRHLVERLAARGDRVVAVDLAADPPVAGAAETHRASVADRAAMARAADGAEAVIHAAAVTGLWARDPSLFEAVNVGGTRTVLEAAAAAGAGRAVHVSSYVTVISGRRSDPERTVDETEAPPEEAMLGPYPRSKWRAERVAAQGPLPAAIVLPSAPIGPGDRAPTPPGRMLRDMAGGRLPALIDCLWALVDIRALAAGVIAALDRGRPGRRYLMTGETLTTDELVAVFERVGGVRGPRARVPYAVALAAAHVEAQISRLTGRPPAAPLTGVRLAGPRLRFDCRRAREELGFDPPPIEGAMRDALLWLRAEGGLARALPGLDQPAG